MTDLNCIWVATVPRTGSMWTANVLKEIFKVANYNSLPKIMMKSDIDILNFYNSSVINDSDRSNKYVLKIHRKLTIVPPRSKIVTNIRNPYDICASFHEFMKCDLERSISVAADLSDWVNYYKKLDKNLFQIKYENIEKNPKSLINELADFCEVQINETQISNIELKFNKNNVNKIIQNNDKEMEIKTKNDQAIDKENVIKFESGFYRYFDINTGFQSGHISKRKSGEWKKVFSTKELNTIIKKLDPIAVELGYSSEKK